jgi:hypothetical protein
MVNLFTGESSDELFGGEVPPQAKALIEQARLATTPERTLALLWTAQVCAPSCPSLYYLLYKFYVREGDFDQAEQAALRGLEVAAEQAHLPDDWRPILVVHAQGPGFHPPAAQGCRIGQALPEQGSGAGPARRHRRLGDRGLDQRLLSCIL